MVIPSPIGLEELAKTRTFARQQAEARANFLAQQQQQQQQGQPGGMLGQGFGPLALNVGMGILANNVPRPYTQGPPSLGAGIARGIQQHLAQQQAQQARQLEQARYESEQQQAQQAKKGTSTRVSGYSHNGFPVFRNSTTGEYLSRGITINPETMKKVPAAAGETTQKQNLGHRREAEKNLRNAKLNGNQEEIDAAQQDLDYWTEVTNSNVSLYGGGGKTERERALTALSRFVGKIGNGESLTPEELRAAEAGIRQVTNPRIVELKEGGYEQVYDPIPRYVAKLAERLNIDIGRGKKKDDSGTGTTVRTLPPRDPPPLTMPQLTSIAELDQSLDLLNRVRDAATTSTVGAIGFFKRGTEVLAGLTDEDANIDATEFKDLVKVIQAKNWREMVGAGQISKERLQIFGRHFWRNRPLRHCSKR